MKKRVLAFILMFSVIACNIVAAPVTSYAKSNSHSNRAVTFLTELNIMQTDEYTGEFWNDSLVKRFELAQILCRLLDYKVEADAEKKFTDVGEIDRPYIDTVVRNGIMSGYGDGRFGPNDYVTYAQVLKIFVELIGGGAYAEVQGGFPNGYISAAKRLDISKSVAVAADTYIHRIDVAQIIYNALHADMVELRGFSGGYADYEVSDENLLSKILDIEIIEGTITAVDSTSLNRANDGAGDGAVIIDGEKVFDPNHYADDYLGSNVTAYVKVNEKSSKSTLIYVEEQSSNTITEIWGDSISDATNKQIKYYDGNKTKTLKFSSITDMVYNGKAVAFDESKFKDSSTVNINLVDRDDDGIIDFVNITEYKDCIVEKVVTEDQAVYLKYGETTLSLKDSYVRILLDGQTATLDDLNSGMVVSVAVSEGTNTDKWVKLMACSETVSGTVDGIGTNGGMDCADIGGKEYPISDAAKALQKKNNIPEIEAGAGGQFYLNTNGEIVYFVSGGSSDDIGYLVAVKLNDNKLTPDVQLKLYTDKGKMEVFKLKEKVNINGVSKKISELSNSVQWQELQDEVAGKQLIKYKAQDDIIKKITYCKDTPYYDPNEFSLDVKESLYVRKQYVLDYKYSVDSSTKVFYVPSDGSQEIEKYKLLNGTYFKRDKTYDVSLYDLTPMGKVSYAIVRAAGSVLTVDNDFMFVTNLSRGLNDEKEEVDIVEGYNTAGNLIKLYSLPGEPLVDYTDKTLTVEEGDFIQYALNALNSIEEIKVVHKASDTGHNGIGTVHNGDRLISFGYAANITSSGFLVSETLPVGEISPLDAKVIVPTGGAVIMYEKSRRIAEKANFTDIVPGDEIFTIGNASNTTMMTIIYR